MPWTSPLQHEEKVFPAISWCPCLFSFFLGSLMFNAVSGCFQISHNLASQALIHPDGLSPLPYLPTPIASSFPAMSFLPAKLEDQRTGFSIWKILYLSFLRTVPPVLERGMSCEVLPHHPECSHLEELHCPSKKWWESILIRITGSVNTEAYGGSGNQKSTIDFKSGE